ncbi:hypothetical protein [Modicisalibacter xianhensis]|mgnify:CR=1 FL=1|nr:hypothetical protein [Halomonas xianhensis]
MLPHDNGPQNAHARHTGNIHHDMMELKVHLYQRFCICWIWAAA